MMLGVLACVACAGGCFTKWLVEEDKYQRAEYEKYLENLKKRG
jgi:epoxyqueuosine reductase QueG